MEGSLIKSQAKNMSSFFGKISESTRSSPATNVAQLKTTWCKINVRGKTIEFDRKEEIFELKRPTDKKFASDQCELCDTAFKKSSKKRKFWEFCGHNFCKDWLYKSRPFYNPAKDPSCPRGECWMICDRKFNAKHIQMFYEDQIDKKEIQIKKGERVLKDKKDTLEGVQAKIKDLEEEDLQKQKAFENEMEDLQTKMDVIQNRIREVTNENEILNKRIQTRNEDAEKKQREKSNLTDEVDTLKKEIMSLEKRLTKLQTRYEETWATTGSGRGRPIKGQRRSGKGKRGRNIGGSESIQSYDAGSYISNDNEKKIHQKLKSSTISKSTKGSLIDNDSSHCKNWVIF